MEEKTGKASDFWHRLGLYQGDTERQAILRDKFYKKREALEQSGMLYFEGPDVSRVYLEEILKRLRGAKKLLDMGCGTGHILRRLGEVLVNMDRQNILLVGLDLSRAMVETASKNADVLCNLPVLIVRGDAYDLPFPNESFDVVISRTSPYSPAEVFRVLRQGSAFVRYDQGPDDYPEIARAFKERYTIEIPTWLTQRDRWKEEDTQRHLSVGFRNSQLSVYQATQYYSREDLMDLIEMVPLAKSFDREKDRKVIDEMEEKSSTERGIVISRQYSILVAEK